MRTGLRGAQRTCPIPPSVDSWKSPHRVCLFTGRDEFLFKPLLRHLVNGASSNSHATGKKTKIQIFFAPILLIDDNPSAGIALPAPSLSCFSRWPAAENLTIRPSEKWLTRIRKFTITRDLLLRFVLVYQSPPIGL